MFCACGMHRRGFFNAAAGAFAATTVAVSPLLAQTSPAPRSTALRSKGEFLLRSGHVLTMDEALGELPSGDIHIRDGAILALGQNLAVPGGEIVDASTMIVMPGFVHDPVRRR